MEEGISDHKVIVAELNIVPITTKENIIVWWHDFSRANDESVLDLLEIRFDEFTQLSTLPDTDIDALWNMFESSVQECLRNFVPLVRKHSNKHNPWINRDIIHLKSGLS